MTPDPGREALAAIVAGLEGVTPGPWRRQTLGGSSTILSPTKPPNNDRRAASYGYLGEEYCLAHAFLDDENRTRMDFVCFGHADAAHISRCHPEAIRSIADYVAKVEARATTAEARAEAGEAECAHFYALAVDDPGKNPPTFWKERVAVLEEALKIFADEADHYDPPEDDDNHPAWSNDFPIGALRRARNALKRETQNADQ